MIELVEVNHYRLLNILDFLLNQHTTITAKEAASLNNTSLITSQRDLKNFYDQFKTTIDLSYATNQLKIERPCISKSCIVSRKIFSKSISLRLFSSILYNPYKSRRFHCDLLSISDATFYRFVENLNTNLESQDIKITSLKGDYFVTAKNENHLRYYIAILLLETEGIYLETPNFDFAHIKEIVIKMMASNHRIEETVLTFQTFLLIAFLMRESQGFSSTPERSVIEMIDAEDLTFPQYHSLKMTYPNLSETAYDNIFYTYGAIHYPWTSIEEKKIIEPKISALYQDINNAIDCRFADEDMKKLLTHLVGFAYHFNLEHKLLIDRAEYFADQFIKEHPYFTNKFFEVITHHLQNFPINMTFQAHFIFYLYLINCPQMYMNMDHIRLKVVSDLGTEHIDFIKSVLISIFKAVDFVEEDEELMIVCNASKEIKEDQNIYIINDYPSQNDLKLIREKMKQILIQRKYKEKSS